MDWLSNCPGDEYCTNVFSQVIILLEDVKDTVIECISDIKEGIQIEKDN